MYVRVLIPTLLNPRFSKEKLTDIFQWVRRTLVLEGIVVNKHRPKHNFTVRDLTRVLLALWTYDDLIFIPERYRVQTMFLIHVYCWTGARISAFFTDGLRYKVNLRLIFCPCRSMAQCY